MSVNLIDGFIKIVDTGLRTVLREKSSSPDQETPTDAEELSDDDRKTSAELMRINHAGEVCAQGLYLGQALVSRRQAVKEQLESAANEEQTHLEWCEQRLRELRSQPSLLNGPFYVASALLGTVTGLAGDRISLGFVHATEDQVVRHLDRHLEKLPESDARSREILENIRNDEQKHGDVALDEGGSEFPKEIRQFMTFVSGIMTRTTRHI